METFETRHKLPKSANQPKPLEKSQNPSKKNTIIIRNQPTNHTNKK